MTPVQMVLGFFGLGASTRKHVCPGGTGCTCGRGVDLRKQQEVSR